MKLNEINTELINKNSSQLLTSEKENTTTMLESDFIKLRKAGLDLYGMLDTSINKEAYKKVFDKMFGVINKYDYGEDKKIVISEWEKGFREGANHSFNFLNSGADLSDECVKQEIKVLDSELKNRIKIATGKNKVSSVLNEK